MHGHGGIMIDDEFWLPSPCPYSIHPVRCTPHLKPSPYSEAAWATTTQLRPAALAR